MLYIIFYGGGDFYSTCALHWILNRDLLSDDDDDNDHDDDDNDDDNHNKAFSINSFKKEFSFNIIHLMAYFLALHTRENSGGKTSHENPQK